MYPGYRIIEKTILANINRLVQLLIEMSAKNSTEKEPYFQEAICLIRELKPLLLHLVEGREEHLEPLIKQLVLQKLPHHRVFGSFGNLQKDLNDILSSSLEPVNMRNEDAPVDTNEIPAASQEYIEQYENTSEENNDHEDKEDSFTSCQDDSSIPSDPVLEEESFSDSEEQENPCNCWESIDTSTRDDEWAQEELPHEVHFSNEETLPTLENIIMKIFDGENILKDYVWRSLSIDYYLPEKKIAIICIKPNYRMHKLYEVFLKKEQIKAILIYPEDLNNIRLLTRKLTRPY